MEGWNLTTPCDQAALETFRIRRRIGRALIGSAILASEFRVASLGRSKTGGAKTTGLTPSEASTYACAVPRLHSAGTSRMPEPRRIDGSVDRRVLP